MRSVRSLAMATLLAAGPAYGAVTCTGSNVNLSLGTYEAYQTTNLDSSGVITVNCWRDGGAANTTVTIGLGQSLNSGSIANRQLKLTGGSDVLAYNFYRDVNRGAVLGNTAGVDTISLTRHIPNKSSLAFSFPVFGRINALQDIRSGNYADTLVLTISF